MVKNCHGSQLLVFSHWIDMSCVSVSYHISYYYTPNIPLWICLTSLHQLTTQSRRLVFQGIWSLPFQYCVPYCSYCLFCCAILTLTCIVGPCGLRSAIECKLLGARTVVVEKRDRFSRNNVLHLWPFVIHDLKSLGTKVFYPKFCAGMLDLKM